jgi:RNA polymerase sigma factor (sigma-70 family)
MEFLDTADLLRRYVERRCEASFAELVRRHRGVVHGIAARRLNGDVVLAEDVVQRVFADLATHAPDLAAGGRVGGWLCRRAARVAADLHRADRRRMAREAEAAASAAALAERSPDPVDAWSEARPILEAAVARLPDPDREAVRLRFVENRPLRAVGEALGISEDAAQKRLTRALARLRGRLVARGITGGTGLLAILAGLFRPRTVRAADQSPSLSSLLIPVMKAKTTAAALLVLAGAAVPLLRSGRTPDPDASPQATPEGRPQPSQEIARSAASAPRPSGSEAKTPDDRAERLQAARAEAEQVTLRRMEEKLTKLRRLLTLTPDQEAALAAHHHEQRRRFIDYIVAAAAGEATPRHFALEHTYRPDIPPHLHGVLTEPQRLLLEEHESVRRTNFIEAVTGGEVDALALKLDLAPAAKDALFSALAAINGTDRFADVSDVTDLAGLARQADHDIARRREAFAAVLSPDQMAAWESEAAAWRQAVLERFGERRTETAAADSRTPRDPS